MLSERLVVVLGSGFAGHCIAWHARVVAPLVVNQLERSLAKERGTDNRLQDRSKLRGYKERHGQRSDQPKHTIRAATYLDSTREGL